VAKYDNADFLPFFSESIGERTAAQEIMDAFKRAIPAIYQFYLYEGFLEAWHAESKQASLPASVGPTPSLRSGQAHGSASAGANPGLIAFLTNESNSQPVAAVVGGGRKCPPED